MAVPDKGGFAAFLMSETPALKERSGLTTRTVEGRVVTQVLDPGPAYRELDGSIPFGSLGFLVDTGVGIATRVGSGWEVGGVNSTLSFEVIQELGSGPLSVVSEVAAFTDEEALGTGVIFDASGAPIGIASSRNMVVPGRPTAMIEPVEYEPVVHPWQADFEPAPVDISAELGLELGDNSASVTTIPRLQWASAYGALHGGAVCLFVHRAVHYAVLHALPQGMTHQPRAFAISFLRPAMCSDEPLICSAHITSRSKRLFTIEATMTMGSGKVAAQVRATHAIAPLNDVKALEGE